MKYKFNTILRPSTASALEQKYFYEDKSIVPAGPVGVIGAMGKCLIGANKSSVLVFR